MDDGALRKGVLEVLRGGSAHLTVEHAVANLRAELRARRPPGELHSVWELLEHMRIAQEDILRYTLDSGWQSPRWPEGYWPETADLVSEEVWQDTVVSFQRDLDELQRLVEDRSVDLTAAIPHGEGRTYLREVLLVADHNAYHLGQIVATRRALGAWAAARS
jgi:uncharacterized damage-inducible protein DinB